MLHIYNSLTRQKEPLQPIRKNEVRMYVCGMTVYDYCHLGHARVLVVFDMVTRYLRAKGYEVTYVRNITDIDDKIIVRANENGEDINVLTERFIDAMHEDSALLGVLPPDIEPRATRHIDEIIEMVQVLENKGMAYHAENGDVYYRVRHFDNYGKLSGKNLDEMQVGARVAEDEGKHDPLDFVLWKASKPDEPYWDSPWGKGRPGWHIECSAMSTKCLGNHFDIHAGGMDLQFPHHENEIAQSEGATGECFANLWMHNGYVQIDKEKMSKSLGNFFTIREIIAQDSAPERMGEIIRFLMLTSHYRSPLNYSDEALSNARQGLERLYKVADRLGKIAPQANDGEADAFNLQEVTYWQRFVEAMDDDFNTPEATAVLFDLAREINRAMDTDTRINLSLLHAVFDQIVSTLGIVTLAPAAFLGSVRTDSDGELVPGYTASQIDAALVQRTRAKSDKNWVVADQIRDELTALGVQIEDKPGGEFSWRVQ